MLRYLVGKGKREEHEHPHLVAGSPEAVRIAGERELSVADAGELARFLDEPREQFGTRVTVAERDQWPGRRDAGRARVALLAGVAPRRARPLGRAVG